MNPLRLHDGYEYIGVGQGVELALAAAYRYEKWVGTVDPGGKGVGETLSFGELWHSCHHGISGCGFRFEIIPSGFRRLTKGGQPYLDAAGRADHPWSAAVERGRSTLPCLALSPKSSFLLLCESPAPYRI